VCATTRRRERSAPVVEDRQHLRAQFGQRLHREFEVDDAERQAECVQSERGATVRRRIAQAGFVRRCE
jgi:hypothetical protein